jgi:UDPglucose 6-dehydrogenase
MREAPSIDVINALQRDGAKVRAYCPGAMDKAKELLSNVKLCKDPYEAVENADALVIMTEWEHFRKADMARVKSLLKNPIILDARNMHEPESMRQLGFEYYCIGRK